MMKSNEKLLTGKTFAEINAGIGGGRLALESLGAESVYAYEADKYSAIVYEENFGKEPERVLVASDVPEHDILLVKLRYEDLKKRTMDINSKVDNIFSKLTEVVEIRKPEVVLIESVSTPVDVLESIVSTGDYIVHCEMLNASDYGIPQSRKSLYCVAIRKDKLVNEFNFPASVELTEYVEDILEPAGDIPAEMYVDRPDVVMNGKVEVETNRPVQNGHIGKNSQGERIYSIKGTAITITANGGGKFSKTAGYLIDGKLRKLTPRECARLMGFPEEFIICESKNQAYKQFGNSVVVDVIQYILLSVADAITEHKVIDNKDDSDKGNTSGGNGIVKTEKTPSTVKGFNDIIKMLVVECYVRVVAMIKNYRYLYRQFNPGGVRLATI